MTRQPGTASGRSSRVGRPHMPRAAARGGGSSRLDGQRRRGGRHVALVVLPARDHEPGRQPGARPPAGGWTDPVSIHCARSYRRDRLSSFEFHISPVASSSRPHTESGFGRPARVRAARNLRRRSVAEGCPPPRRRPEYVRPTKDESHSGRSETCLPSDCRRHLRRRHPGPCRSGLGPVSAR